MSTQETSNALSLPEKSEPNSQSLLQNPCIPTGFPSKTVNEYVNLVGHIMYPSIMVKEFGYAQDEQKYPIFGPSSLGYLRSPVRRNHAIEKWSPYEIATFEGALALFGKKFSVIQRYIGTKTTKEIIEFYYIWKKTDHYKDWKLLSRKQFEDAMLEYEPELTGSEIAEDEPEETDATRKRKSNDDDDDEYDEDDDDEARPDRIKKTRKRKTANTSNPVP